MNQFQVPLLEGIELINEARKDMNGQSKSVRYVLSHETGKIEILGKTENQDVIKLAYMIVLLEIIYVFWNRDKENEKNLALVRRKSRKGML